MLVFFLQLPEPPQFGHAQAAVLFLSVVVSGLANAHFAAHLGDGHTRVRLAQGEHDLRLGKLGLFHDIVY